MTSTKPYLLRAIYEWAEDHGFTAQVLVNAESDGVEVPEDHVVDGQIVLNICSAAVQMHTMDNESLSFSARFNGIEQAIYLPLESVVAIFARENSQGIFFEDSDGEDPEPDAESTAPHKKASTTNINKKRGKSHLKIIK